MGNADFSKQFLLKRKTKLHTLSTFVNFIIISSMKRKKIRFETNFEIYRHEETNCTFELKTIVTQNTGVCFFRTITSHENSLDYIHFS